MPASAARRKILGRESAEASGQTSLVTAVMIRDGKAYAPDRPGHGLVLSEKAVARWASTDPAVDPAPFEGAPPSPIDYSGISTLRSTAREHFMAEA